MPDLLKNIPYEYFIQSPIGLVPKDNGKATRLIFHLSYPRTNNKNDIPTSVNGNTPSELTTINYPDFETAVKMLMSFPEDSIIYIGKSDLKSAFRNLGICMEDWPLLVMKAKSPIDGKWYYFIDKCLPFGASISCSHFQAFSDALKHIHEWRTGSETINYLDDFLFAALRIMWCNNIIQSFLDTCAEINFPVSLEKTCWATPSLTFLGLLIDTLQRKIFIPIEKVSKALIQIEEFIGSRKATIKQIQRLTGLLNFFSRCVIPARVFTRRMYSLTNGNTNKPHYHKRIPQEIKLDLIMWRKFLSNQAAYNRPFSDFCNTNSDQIDMYTDSSANAVLGCGGKWGKKWFVQQWDSIFIKKNEPSINYLELYAVTAAVILWIENFANKRVTLFCDNMGVVHMINSNSSRDRNCMILLRLIILQGMIYNVRISAKHVLGINNEISDSLSRLKFEKFEQLTEGQGYDEQPTQIPEEIWPMEKVWH